MIWQSQRLRYISDSLGRFASFASLGSLPTLPYLKARIPKNRIQ
jgi:hypothetical protein